MQISSDTDNTDPKYLRYIVEQGAQITVGGLLNSTNQVATGTLASVNHLTEGGPGNYFNADLGSATGAVGQLIDIVHSGAHYHAWLKQNTSGNVWTMSVPLVATAAGGFTFDNVQGVQPPLEDCVPGAGCTIANGDAYTTYQPTAMNIVEHAPMLSDWSASSKNLPTVQQATIYDPTNDTSNERQSMYLGGNGSQLWIDVQFNRAISATNLNASRLPTTFINPFLRSSAAIAAVSNTQSVGRPQMLFYPNFYGGIIGGNKPTVLGNAYLGQDIIISTPTTIHDGFYSCVAIDSGAQLNVTGYVVDMVSPTCGGGVHSVTWGAGLLGTAGSAAHIVYAGSGATGFAVSTFLNSGGLNLNGLTVACSGNQQTIVTACNLSLTPTLLDTAIGSGGFAGNAWVPGGGSITCFF